MVPPLPFSSIDSKFWFMGTTLSLILSRFTLMKYSDDGSPGKEVAPVLTGFVTNGVKVNREAKSVS